MQVIDVTSYPLGDTLSQCIRLFVILSQYILLMCYYFALCMVNVTFCKVQASVITT
jgi:hypothetical protein